MLCSDKMKEDVKLALERYTTHISQMDGVQRIYLFGSYAYGEPHEYSDIDLYVIVEDKVDIKEFMYQANLDLQERYVPLDILADTERDFNKLSQCDSPTLQREVKEKGVILYDK